jgi:hypothetical protein
MDQAFWRGYRVGVISFMVINAVILNKREERKHTEE